MNILLFALLLSSTLAKASFLGLDLNPKFSPLKLLDSAQDTDPAEFNCVHDKSRGKFTTFNSSTGSMDEIVTFLNNGRGLSLYIFDVFDNITINRGFRTAAAWYKESKTNVCFVTYKSTQSRLKAILTTKVFQRKSAAKKIVKTKRIEVLAEQIGDLVLNVRKQCANERDCLKMQQVTIVGLGSGAHIGAFTSRYISDELNGEKIGKLIGLDPREIHALPLEDYIKSGDAKYVQIVHTSKFIGTKHRTGDSDIIVKIGSIFQEDSNHEMADYLNKIIVTGKWIVVAEINGNGLFERTGSENLPEEFSEDQCIVGPYGKPRYFHRTFYVTLSKKQLARSA